MHLDVADVIPKPRCQHLAYLNLVPAHRIPVKRPAQHHLGPAGLDLVPFEYCANLIGKSLDIAVDPLCAAVNQIHQRVCPLKGRGQYLEIEQSADHLV